MQTGVMDTFRWMRVIGDTIFAAGTIALAAFVIGLRFGGTRGGERFHAVNPAPLPGRP
jgi:hypothetical protein